MKPSKQHVARWDIKTATLVDVLQKFPTFRHKRLGSCDVKQPLVCCQASDVRLCNQVGYAVYHLALRAYQIGCDARRPQKRKSVCLSGEFQGGDCLKEGGSMGVLLAKLFGKPF